MNPKIYLPLLAASVVLSAWLYLPSNTNSVAPVTPPSTSLSPQPRSVDADLKVPPDAMPNPLPTNLAEIETAAGKLICVPGLCRTTVTYAPQSEEGPPSSEHLVRLKQGAPELKLGCSEGASSDPACRIEGRDIAGEKFYVLGDGCIYVRQYYNAYFPLTKKYCLAPINKLYRVHQTLYAVGFKVAAFDEIPVLTSKTDGTPVGKVLKGEAYTVEAAEVDESEDFYGQADWYLIRDLHGNTGWVQKSHVVSPYCDPTDEKTICFRGD